jgi:hypothetical protein
MIGLAATRNTLDIALGLHLDLLSARGNPFHLPQLLLHLDLRIHVE